MKVYIANFGSGNWAWPQCLERSAIAVMDDMQVHPYWQRGDREGYVRQAIRVLKTQKDKTPPRSTATRWYNANTILMETAGDLWIHREKSELWWTVSTADPAEKEIIDDPAIPTAKVKIAVYYKRCDPWNNTDRKGRVLTWAGLHPKARDFLFTEGTFQEPQADNALYAQALIDGLDLSEWHKRAEWRAKEDRSGKGVVKTFSPEEILTERQKATARRIAQTAWDTALQSGAIVQSVIKDKRFGFATKGELETFLQELMKKQNGFCALTSLEMLLDDDVRDHQCRYSLDRIDSAGHYAPDNLQLVCKFVNQWKGVSDNEEFKRLIEMIRERSYKHSQIMQPSSANRGERATFNSSQVKLRPISE